MNAAETMRGQCLCGSVTITAHRNTEVEVCHCGMYRRWGGGPLMVVHCGSAVQVEGADHVTTFSSSEWAERAFCAVCGTHLFYRLKNQGLTLVSAGLLQDEQDFKFTEQIFIDKKPAYYAFANQTHTLTEAEVIAKFSQL